MKEILFGQKNRKATSERGMALVIVLLVLVALSFAGVSLLSSTAGQTRAGAAESVASQSLECAVAGGNWGLGRLSGNLYGGLSRDSLLTVGMSGSLGTSPLQGAVTVSVVDNDDGDSNLTHDTDGKMYTRADCRVQTSKTHVEMLGNPFMGTAFSGGVTGCDNVTLGASTETDSYNSLNGVYGGANVFTTGGNVVSNGNVNINGATVYGDVYAGGNIYGGGSIHGNAWAGGTVSGVTVLGTTTQGTPPPASARCTGATTVAGSTIDSMVNWAKTHNNNITNPPLNSFLEDGKYYCSTAPKVECCTTRVPSPLSDYGGQKLVFSLGGNDKCAFSTGAYYFVEFQIGGTAEVVVDSRLDPTNNNDNVVIYFDERTSVGTGGPFSLLGTGLTNAQNKDLNLEMYSRSDTQVDMRGTADFCGLLYAPYASQILKGTSAVYGAIFGQLVDISGNPDVHFDINLLQRKDYDQGFSPLAGTWRAKRPS